MKTKIFNALKTKYSHLGLGDEILGDHAEALAALNMITDDNLEAVISVQGNYLANLQKHNDRRVNEAVAKTKKEAEDEAAKKKAADEAAAKAAAEEAAKKKAEEEEAAKKAAEEEAARKAAEEARKAAEAEEARKMEEMRKNTEIPDWFKQQQAEAAAANKKREEEYLKQIEALRIANEEARKTSADTFRQQQDEFAKFMEQHKALQDNYAAMKKEADDAKAAMAAQHRKDFILGKAKELGIPQYRIDEGFVIPADADETAITNTLSTIANNIKVNAIPARQPSYQHSDGTATPEELKSIAAALVH